MDTVCSREEVGQKTNADKVFDSLRQDINRMRLLPGAKLSEADLASQFGVSRQPVREALIRLDHLCLVSIKAQKATTVRRISRIEITRWRFARLSIELEIARLAAQVYDGKLDKAFANNLRQQRESIKALDLTRFNTLDFDFHHLMSQAAQAEYAFQCIVEAKTAIDRMCILALTDKRSMKRVYDDHRATFKALQVRDEAALINSVRMHLGRIDEKLDQVEQAHAEFLSD